METIMDQEFVLFLKTLKTNFIRYSVSPGHDHIPWDMFILHYTIGQNIKGV